MENFGSGLGPERPSTTTPETDPTLFSIEPKQDLPHGGLLLPDQYSFVTDIQHVDTFESRRGVINEHIVRMNDGTLYPVIIGEPNARNLRSDTAVVMMTAWMTSTKGHNRRTVVRMQEEGYPTIMIGPEGEETNHDISFIERMKLAATASLYKNAHDANRILDEILAMTPYRQDVIINIGESRAAMQGPGLNVEQYSPDRRVAYLDLTAPCFARSPSAREMPAVGVQALKEILELGKLATRLPFQARGKHYAKTLHTHPEYYIKEPLKVPHLLSGEAGKLARAARPNTPGHVLIFRGDGWSQVDEWEEIYGTQENIYLEVAEGKHLSIADPDTLDNIGLRLSALAESRGDRDFDTVDFSAIIGLHKYGRVAQQRKRSPLSVVPA